MGIGSGDTRIGICSPELRGIVKVRESENVGVVGGASKAGDRLAGGDGGLLSTCRAALRPLSEDTACRGSSMRCLRLC